MKNNILKLFLAMLLVPCTVAFCQDICNTCSNDECTDCQKASDEVKLGKAEVKSTEDEVKLSEEEENIIKEITESLKSHEDVQSSEK